MQNEIRRARAQVAEAAVPFGVVPLAVAGPVAHVPERRSAEVSPNERYRAIADHYGEVAHQSLMCALHVHVEVADDEEGVAVIDRVRPWIPMLIAVSGNSPYWHGRDTGYDSWRSRIWNLWPTGGPAEPFGDAATYHAVVGDMVTRGAALDIGMVNLDVRLSHRYPTVEFRVADVCTDVEDALVVAALARALVDRAAHEWHLDTPAETWRVDELRAAAWRASRFGLRDTLVSPVSRKLEPASDVLAQLVGLVSDQLEEAGDTAVVERGVTAFAARGNAADRQRTAYTGAGGLEGVLADLMSRTLQP